MLFRSLGAEGCDLASTSVLCPPTSTVPIYRGESRGTEQRCIWGDLVDFQTAVLLVTSVVLYYKLLVAVQGAETVLKWNQLEFKRGNGTDGTGKWNINRTCPEQVPEAAE